VFECPIEKLDAVKAAIMTSGGTVCGVEHGFEAMA
jgi:hypothetical protein